MKVLPQNQTLEHLSAIDLLKIQNFIILQNKVDLVREQEARNQHQAITKYTEGTVAANAPVIPISAQWKYNMDAVCEYIVKKIPVPVRDFTSPPHMIVIRSFDVNKPGSTVDEVKGGVVGGSITKGVLKVNQIIELRPGLLRKDASGKFICTPIHTRVASLQSELNEVQIAVPGGLIGVGTTMNPTLSPRDALVGQVLGQVGTLPEVFTEFKIGNIYLMKKLLGVSKDTAQGKVSVLVRGEILLVNISSMATGAKVLRVKDRHARLSLTVPVCTALGEKVILSRRVLGHWRLIGWGVIKDGITLDVSAASSEFM